MTFLVHLFHATVLFTILFLYPLKTSKNPMIFWCFQGGKERGRERAVWYGLRKVLIFRSSHRKCSVQKVFLIILQISSGLQVCNFIKTWLQHRCYPVKLSKFVRTPISKNICDRLLLKLSKYLKNLSFYYRKGFVSGWRVMSTFL